MQEQDTLRIHGQELFIFFLTRFAVVGGAFKNDFSPTLIKHYFFNLKSKSDNQKEMQQLHVTFSICFGYLLDMMEEEGLLSRKQQQKCDRNV